MLRAGMLHLVRVTCYMLHVTWLVVVVVVVVVYYYYYHIRPESDQIRPDQTRLDQTN